MLRKIAAKLGKDSDRARFANANLARSEGATTATTRAPTPGSPGGPVGARFDAAAGGIEDSEPARLAGQPQPGRAAAKTRGLTPSPVVV